MWRRVRIARLFIGLLLVPPFVALLAPPVDATTPAPTPETLTPEEWEMWLEGGPGLRLPMPPSLGPWNFVREFDQMVAFFAEWQLLDPDSVDYGGMIEAEAGPLGNVIQTDNTLEAIWCWSRYREFSGRDTYDPNVEAAWVYCRNFTAWTEEGGAGDDYYRVHNCAWGLTAVLQYEAATGDLSFAGYADTCAQYIMDHSLNIHDGTIYQQRLDSFVKGWAAGNLYLFGEARGDTAMMFEAVAQGTDVFEWLDTDPTQNLTYEYWAMSSGTAMWGVCNSVFRNDPGLGMTWCTANAGYMDVWQEWYNAPGYDWDAAWNVAYCNAHFAVWEVTGDDTYWENGALITDRLLSLDTDDDGGIVSNTHDPVTEDMTWVSCYLVKMGVDRLMGTPFEHDAGALKFASPAHGEPVEVGAPVEIIVMTANHGLSDESAVDVRVADDIGSWVQTVDLSFASLDSVTLGVWVPENPGMHVLTAWTEMAGDQDSSNDSTSVFFIVVPADIAVPGTSGQTALAFAPRPWPNPFAGSVGLSFGLSQDAAVRLELFDLSGRLVRRIDGGMMSAGERRIAWDGRDVTGRKAGAGIYLYRLVAGDESRSGKIVRIR